MTKKSEYIHVEKFVQHLNTLLKRDREVISKLFLTRVDAGSSFYGANANTLYDENQRNKLGSLGVINGYIETLSEGQPVRVIAARVNNNEPDLIQSFYLKVSENENL